MAVRYARSTNFRSYGGTRVTEDLTRHGIELPADVVKARDRLDALVRRQKTAPADIDHRQTAVTALLDDPTCDIDHLVDAELRAATVANVVTQATDQARAAVADALAANADKLVRSLRTRMFEPAVAILTTAASTDPNTTVAGLLRAGDPDGARALADAPAAAETIRAAYHLRAGLYRGSGIDNLVCARWNPRPTVELHHDLEGLTRWLSGLRAGGRLWFGTYAEVDDASRKATAKKAPTPRKRQANPEPLDAA